VASVVEQYIEHRRTHAQLKLLDRALALQQKTLAIVEARFTAGLAAQLDVQRATADAARTAAQRGLLEIARTQARVTLAVLLGTHAGDLELTPSPEEEADPPIYTAGPGLELPAAVVRNRPDLRAAEARLLAAVSGIGVEVADLYPTLRLPGRITANAGSAAALTGRIFGVLGTVIDLPFLDAGRRRAEVAAARARADAALALYRRTLLTALNEVENALVAIRAAEDRRRELAGAVTAIEQAYEQLAALNREGLATFIDILDAQRVLILSREAYVDSEAGVARAVVALHRATGASTKAG
jgi:multidrug efflux system outer membrane protein